MTDRAETPGGGEVAVERDTDHEQGRFELRRLLSVEAADGDPAGPADVRLVDLRARPGGEPELDVDLGLEEGYDVEAGLAVDPYEDPYEPDGDDDDWLADEDVRLADLPVGTLPFSAEQADLEDPGLTEADADEPVRRPWATRPDRRYGDRVEGWVRPEYRDEPVTGDYWTPIPDAGYGWPVPVERIPAVPPYPPASGFDPLPEEESEPTAVVPQWPPVRPDDHVGSPRAWSQEERPAGRRFFKPLDAPSRRRSAAAKQHDAAARAAAPKGRVGAPGEEGAPGREAGALGGGEGSLGRSEGAPAGSEETATATRRAATARGQIAPGGARGTEGTQGTEGTAGTRGTAGTAGTAGTRGTVGTAGTAGTRGTAGTAGTAGIAGTAGTAGTEGGHAAEGSVAPVTPGTVGSPEGRRHEGWSARPRYAAESDRQPRTRTAWNRADQPERRRWRDDDRDAAAPDARHEGGYAGREESVEGPVWTVPDLPEAALPDLTWPGTEVPGARRRRSPVMAQRPRNLAGEPTQSLPAVTDDREGVQPQSRVRPRPRPRPRPEAAPPDQRSTVYVSKHAADPG
ncbi:hypothetical protein COUCH_04655 [Couchioplanes caeruleus]|uniref:hypothetical protein n=1 Tax=Couchioplanes caeruleus TaxID=56438 RepID=UPI0020C0B211|nr:hypothetical protein [Couchioplanes caeruleus]UQU65619.1 hypothetical protein COUCH_04655 [Couchioplanes caeruleus]